MRLQTSPGICFSRLPDGSVLVENIDPKTGKPRTESQVIQWGQWISVVAHVSARGETSASREIASAFHQCFPSELPSLTDATDALENTEVSEPRRL